MPCNYSLFSLWINPPIIFLIWLTKCLKIVKKINACHNFLMPKVTSSDCLFCPTNCPNPSYSFYSRIGKVANDCLLTIFDVFEKKLMIITFFLNSCRSNVCQCTNQVFQLDCKQSLELRVCINPLLKIVPNKLTVSSYLKLG